MHEINSAFTPISAANANHAHWISPNPGFIEKHDIHTCWGI